MPVFIRPARVDVTEGGAHWQVPAAVVVCAAWVYATIAFVAAWWPLIVGCTAITATAWALAMRALHRRTVRVWRTPVAAPPLAAQALSAPRRELPAAVRAIGAPVIVVTPSRSELVPRPPGDRQRQQNATAEQTVKQHDETPS